MARAAAPRAVAERSVRVSTLELFFDLVFVFTITQLTGVLVDGEGLAALVQVAAVTERSGVAASSCPARRADRRDE